MIIRLLSNQIPEHWETIKFVIEKVNTVEDDILPRYLNNLLHALLNDTAQCFIRLDDDRRIIALLVTKIYIDKETEEKVFFFHSVYSFRKRDDDVWLREAEFLKNFAIKENCNCIKLFSNNESIWRLVKLMGFKERSRLFSYPLLT